MPPAPPARLLAVVRYCWSGPDARAIWPIFLVTRVGVLVVGFLAVVLLGYATAMPWRVYDNDFHNLPARWDTGWYLGVAVDGYNWYPPWIDRQQNIAFFPAFPMLMRYGALLLGRETMWTGVAISFIAFFFALVYLVRLARQWVGEDAAIAGAWLLAAYPFALFYSAAYSEGLFLLAIVGACYHFERDELGRAALWGVLAGLTRPNGCLLSVVLALMALRGMTVRRLAAAAAPGIGMLIYSAYIYHLTGNPLQWAAQNAAWGRVYRGLDQLVWDRVDFIGQFGLYGYASMRSVELLQALAVILVLASVWPVYRRFGLPYAAMILVNVLPPLAMGGFLSMGRVTAILFPTFLWLGAALSPATRMGWLAGFGILQGLCAALFFTWRPLY